MLYRRQRGRVRAITRRHPFFGSQQFNGNLGSKPVNLLSAFAPRRSRAKMQPALLIAILNSCILFAYAILERTLPFSFRWSRVGITAIAVLVIVAALLAKAVRSRVANLITNAQLTLFSCLLVFVIGELLFTLAPGAFPDNLRALTESGQASARQRERIVELLPHSPYAKPRANTTIHIPGYYGPKESFAYEWTTDRLGFKNTKSIASLKSVKVVAPGDSFTEGMGVAVEDTWTSQLSKMGHTAYSLGVQGYAPTQFRGAYEHYGRALSPEWVVVGYTGGVFLRDEYFQSKRDSQRSAQEFDLLPLNAPAFG